MAQRHRGPPGQLRDGVELVTVAQARAYLEQRAWAYQVIFGTLDATPEARARARELVLKDLDYFCNVTQPTFSKDATEMAYLEGRRSVAMRVRHHIHEDGDALWARYDGRTEEHGRRDDD